MRWWNLQLGNRCEYAAWIAAIAESGVMSAEEAREFVVPGYRASCSTPEFVAYDIEGIRLLAGGIGGVFLRRYEDVRPRAADWARAVALAAV
jgi:hypothetical protein